MQLAFWIPSLSLETFALKVRSMSVSWKAIAPLMKWKARLGCRPS